MRLLPLALCCAVLLTACASTGPMALTATYNPAEGAWAAKSGTSTITGQGFLRRNDGVVVYAAGSEADLIPQTSYSAVRVSGAFPNGSHLSYGGLNYDSTDPAYASTVRKTTADGEGKFTFSNVPAGSYYVTTSVIWEVGYERQGGLLMMPVTVAAGQTANVILSGQ